MLRSRVWGRAKAPPRRKAIAVGDVVEIGSMGFVGTVLTEPDEDQKIDVQVGSARIRDGDLAAVQAVAGPRNLPRPAR